MAIYGKVFPTRWPLLDFQFSIWKLSIATQLMRESMESMSYEYIRLGVAWGNDLKWHFRLYDTYQRQMSKPALNK